MAMSKLQRIYWKFRAAGFNAIDSKRNAGIVAEFHALESQGLARIRVESDTDPDLSFIGKYTNKWESGAIDRKKAGDWERGEFQYFVSADPKYARENYKQMERIQRDGNSYGTVGEWRRSSMNEQGEPLGDDEGWEECDSVWGHLGYKDPSSPYENAYVIDHMRACIDAYRDSVAAALGQVS